MAERFVYLNGDYVPERDAKVSVLEVRLLEFPDDLSGSKRSKRHGEEALRAGRTPLPPSPRWGSVCLLGLGSSKWKVAMACRRSNASGTSTPKSAICSAGISATMVAVSGSRVKATW